jgi:predicted PurR-regulated permease PerM
MVRKHRSFPLVKATHPKPPTDLQNRALISLLVLVTLALVWIVLPFYGTILWAGIIALLFVPLHRWLFAQLKGRRTLAALLTLATVLVIVILPLALIAAAMAGEAASLYQRLQSGEVNPASYLQGVFDALPRWITALLDRLGLTDFDTLQRRLTRALSEGTQYIATQAFSLGQNTFEFVASLFVTLYLAFFLIRDGDDILRVVRRSVPLTNADKYELAAKFSTVVRATVKGNLLVAAIQGALGGVAFWFLGVRGALLWGVLMAFLSLLPAVGAALVWVPVALYFFFAGAYWQCVALAAWGVFVIGLVDNLLRPMLVGKDTRMPDYVVMITTLGGLAIFGINGFVLGPAIAAMFMAVWHIYGVAHAGEAR